MSRSNIRKGTRDVEEHATSRRGGVDRLLMEEQVQVGCF
jgi:hypothetical protein